MEFKKMKPGLDIKQKILSLKAPELKALLAAVEGGTGSRYGRMKKADLQVRVRGLLADRGPELLTEMGKLGGVVRRPNTRSGQGHQGSTNCPSNVATAPASPGRTRPGPGFGLTLTSSSASATTSASPISSNPGNCVEPPPQPSAESSFLFMQNFKTQLVGQQAESPSVGNKDDIAGDPHAPIPPGIKMRDLPFFDCHFEPIPLSKLIPGKAIRCKLAEDRGKEMKRCTFSILPAQLETTGKPGDMEFILRFGDLTMASPDGELDDLLPSQLRVIVNDDVPYFMQNVSQGMKVKITNRPIEITKCLSMKEGTTNTITVVWEDNGLQTYVMSMLAGNPLTAPTLRTRLLAKPPLPVSTSISIVEELTSEEHQGLVCAPPSVRVSLTCPLGKQRMRYPCRGRACRHLQCFDGYAFLQMNEKKLKFNCPVCGGRLKFEDLCVDGFFRDVIKTTPLHAGEEFNIHRNGWLEPVVEAQREEIDVDCESPKKRVRTAEDDDVVILNSSRPAVPVQKQVASKDMNGRKGEPELIILDD